MKNIESKINQIMKISDCYEKILSLERCQQESEDIFNCLLEKYRSNDYDRRTYHALKEILVTQRNINYNQRLIVDEVAEYYIKESFGIEVFPYEKKH